MELKKLTSSIIANKRVIVRVDFNVPLKKHGSQLVVADDNRILQALDTIKFLQQNNARIILISHLGRPKNEPDANLSLEPVAKRLGELLNTTVKFVPDCTGPAVQKVAATQEPGSIMVVENLRFHAGEKKNESTFAKELASLGDVFVNEAFSTSHRSHASIVGISKLLPSYPGFSFAKEVATFDELMIEPKRPFVMVIGGAKISDKVEAVEHLASIADAVLVGGGVANNFLKAEGFDIAKSYLQDVPADLKKQGVDYVEVAEELMEDTKQQRLVLNGYIPLPKIMYPTDVVAATSPESTSGEVVELVNGNHADAMKRNVMYLDIGPKTIRLFKEVILQAGTVFWNGPMGVFENKAFEDGTKEIAMAIAKSGARTVLGGGDTIAAVRAFKLENRYDYISAAGGAALDYLAGKSLPGIEPLLKHKN